VATSFGCHIKCILYHYLHYGNYLNNEATYSDFKEGVVFLVLKTSLSLDELYKECYVIKTTLSLFLSEEFVLKERDSLETAKPNKKYVFNSK
jgi:hypothetical protein